MATTNNNHQEFSIQFAQQQNGREILIIRHARLMFTNFAGTKTQYNRQGDRNFSAVIDDAAAAEELLEHGWNIKIREPRTPDENPLCTLKVNVRFDGRTPPKVFMVNDRERRMIRMNEHNVAELDASRILFADIAIRPYHYEQGGGGISAYLIEARCHVEPGIFDEDYSGYSVDTSSLNDNATIDYESDTEGQLPF